ncbi:MAG: pirin family protein [Candidatus Aminicenantes bacterium]|nr:MAG: pirin family protein [Candidatus Aminicenantes bacterium]
MRNVRKIKNIFQSRPTIEGAGVRLKRVFGNADVPTFDPFLLLDDFHSANPEDYLPGFPWHPHRGIETVTYMLEGKVEHGDSLGNKGIIQSGEMQWMTAGSGIIHQEMPEGNKGLMWGLQLWVNLPASHKMMKPRYRDVRSKDIPEYRSENGTQVKVISGTYKERVGPVKDIICDPEYLDVSIPAGRKFEHDVKRGHTVFAYVLEGGGFFHPEKRESVLRENLVHFSDGETVVIEASEEPLRFLLISGKPIGEPVAWYGPIVMNTEEELKRAFEEYQNGTFIKN